LNFTHLKRSCPQLYQGTHTLGFEQIAAHTTPFAPELQYQLAAARKAAELG